MYPLLIKFNTQKMLTKTWDRGTLHEGPSHHEYPYIKYERVSYWTTPHHQQPSKLHVQVQHGWFRSWTKLSLGLLDSLSHNLSTVIFITAWGFSENRYNVNDKAMLSTESISKCCYMSFMCCYSTSTLRRL